MLKARLTATAAAVVLVAAEEGSVDHPNDHPSNMHMKTALLFRLLTLFHSNRQQPVCQAVRIRDQGQLEDTNDRTRA
jgi:hypothetical protein